MYEHKSAIITCMDMNDPLNISVNLVPVSISQSASSFDTTLSSLTSAYSLSTHSATSIQETATIVGN